MTFPIREEIMLETFEPPLKWWQKILVRMGWYSLADQHKIAVKSYEALGFAVVDNIELKILNFTPSFEEISKRAYEISQSSESGSETENWLRAEQELNGTRDGSEVSSNRS